MPLLRSLEFFLGFSFLQRFQPYGLAAGCTERLFIFVPSPDPSRLGLSFSISREGGLTAIEANRYEV